MQHRTRVIAATVIAAAFVVPAAASAQAPEPTNGSITVGPKETEWEKGSIVLGGKKEEAPEPVKGAIKPKTAKELITIFIYAKGGIVLHDQKDPRDPTKGWIVYMHPKDIADPGKGMTTSVLPYTLPGS